MDDIVLVINTHSSYGDLWKMFFDSLEQYLPTVKRYVFVDEEIPDEKSITFHYDKTNLFRTQFLNCIKKVKEKYCIFISEDYILYDKPRLDLIERYKNILEENKYLSFIRFTKGIEYGEPKFKKYEDLYEMSNVFPYFYSQTAGLWRTRDLEKIFLHSNDAHIANTDYENSFEWQATSVCQRLNIQGLLAYHGERKRGKYHYDNIIFPYIVTALVKGKWNISGYRQELMPVLQKYKIDPRIRGVR